MHNVLNGDCMRGQRFCCVSGLQVLNIFWSFLSFCYFIQNVSFCYFIQDLHIYTKDMSPVSGLCVNQSQRNKICYQEQDRQKQKHITSGLEWPSQCKYLKRDNVTITTITRPNVNIETRSSPYDHKHDDHNHNGQYYTLVEQKANLLIFISIIDKNINFRLKWNWRKGEFELIKMSIDSSLYSFILCLYLEVEKISVDHNLNWQIDKKVNLRWLKYQSTPLYIVA